MRRIPDQDERIERSNRGEMTLADQIREHAHVASAYDVAMILGCDPSWVRSLRWRDKNRERFNARRRK